VLCLVWGTKTSVCSTRAFPPGSHHFLFLCDISLLAVNSRLLSESGGPCECSKETRDDPGCVFYDPDYALCVEMFRRELVTVDVFPIWFLCWKCIYDNAKMWGAASYFFVYWCLREIEKVWRLNSIILCCVSFVRWLPSLHSAVASSWARKLTCLSTFFYH